MQKKELNYVSPSLDITELDDKDIVTVSAGTNSGADGNQGDGNWWD